MSGELAVNDQLNRLLRTFHPTTPRDDFKGWKFEVTLALGERIGEVALERAVSLWLRREQRLPTPAALEALARQCQDAVDAAQAALAAESPTPRLPSAATTPAIDPTDPYSSTPEERERWAREDAWIRTWAARIKPTPPEILTRLNAADRDYFIDADRRNASVANWPNLRPAERRAKERRIEQQRLAAFAQIRRHLGRPPLPGDEVYGIPPHPAPPVERDDAAETRTGFDHDARDDDERADDVSVDEEPF